jgi:hypothetical protein
LACGLIAVATVLGGCVGPAGLSGDRSALVAVGKAAGAVGRRLPANCARIYVGGRWATIDEPAWNSSDKRCTPFSREGVLVFRRVDGRWRLVTVKGSGYGHYGGCSVDRVPREVAKRFPLC